jgi:hypothetical protein
MPTPPFPDLETLPYGFGISGLASAGTFLWVIKLVYDALKSRAISSCPAVMTLPLVSGASQRVAVSIPSRVTTARSMPLLLMATGLPLAVSTPALESGMPLLGK